MLTQLSRPSLLSQSLVQSQALELWHQAGNSFTLLCSQCTVRPVGCYATDGCPPPADLKPAAELSFPSHCAGYSVFRPSQEEAITAALSGNYDHSPADLP